MHVGLVLTLALSLAPQDSGEPPPASLESLLESVRARREAVLAEWAPVVDGLLARFEDRDEDGVPVGLEGLRAELARAAQHAAPLLVPWIEPGESPQEAAVLRADEVARALEATAARGITRELVQLARSGTKPARRHAVRLLARTEDPEVVGPTLRRVFQESQGALAQAAARALVLGGGEQGLATIRTAFRESQGEALQVVVGAVVEAAHPGFAAEVGALVRDPQRAAPVADEVFDYYEALPEVFDGEAGLALLRLIASPYPSDATRIRLLERLPDLGLEGREAREALEQIVAEASRADSEEVADAARICLAILGDRRAKKRALLFFDRQVDRDRSWPGAYEQRGDLLLRMREYGDAVRDFRRAIELSRDDGKPTRELRVRLARAYARSGKLRSASEALRSAALTPRRLEELREDEDFAEVAAHSRYGKVFE